MSPLPLLDGWASVPLGAAWGLVSGLLIRRPAWRLAVPHGQPWRSTCTAGHPLTTGPAGGWLSVTACRSCPADWWLPTLCALGCALLAAHTGPHPVLGVWWLALPVLLLLSVVDWRVQRLPFPITLPLAGSVLLLLAVAALAAPAWDAWTRALLAALALAVLFALAALAGQQGGGDVALAVTVGALAGWDSWRTVLAAVFLAYLLTALAGLFRRQRAVAFGPFLVLGLLATTLLSPTA